MFPEIHESGYVSMCVHKISSHSKQTVRIFSVNVKGEAIRVDACHPTAR